MLGLLSEPLELEGDGGDWYWGTAGEGPAEARPEVALTRASVLDAIPALVWKASGPIPCSPYGFPYMGKPVIFIGGWKGLYGTSPHLLPMMRFREGIPALLLAAPPPPPALSMTFRFRMMRPRLTSLGLTRRFRMRTVSEKGETGGREEKEPLGGARGSGRGRGRRDMRWQRRMSFFSLWEAAREWSFGEGAAEDEDEDEEEEEEVGLDAGAAELEEEGGRAEGGREEERRGAAREPEARVDGSPAWARACTEEA